MLFVLLFHYRFDALFGHRPIVVRLGVHQLRQRGLVLALLHLLTDVLLERLLVEPVVEVLGHDVFLVLFLDVLELLKVRHVYWLAISAVQLDVLLFLRLLVEALQLVDVSFPGFHAHFVPLLLQLQVVHLLIRIIVLLHGLPVQEAVPATLEHHCSC